MNFGLIQELLIIAIVIGSIMTLFLQKIKESIEIDSKKMILLSFILNMVTGVLFTVTFSEQSLVNGLWVGLFAFIGADVIYKALEDKLGFKSLTKIKEGEENGKSITK